MHPATLCQFFVVALTNLAFVSAEIPVVIVLSFDGLTSDLVDSKKTPALHELMTTGTLSGTITPIFPSRTAANHYTIATGLYPEKHGVVDDCLFIEPDKDGNEIACNTYQLYHQNDNIVPIWLEHLYTGEVGRISSCINWPGSQFIFHGNSTDSYYHFNYVNQTIEKCILELQDLIKSKDNPANFSLNYFNQLKVSIQEKGLESNETIEELKNIDKIIGNFIHWLKDESGIKDKVSLIILGGHGFQSVNSTNIINLNEVFSGISCAKCDRYIVMGANALVNPNPDEYESVYKSLETKAQSNNTFKVYKKDDIPLEWHIKDANVLNNTIFLQASSGYGFLHKSNEDSKENDDNKPNSQKTAQTEVAMDGYYVEAGNSKNPIFIGWGHKFKRGHSAVNVNMIDIHPLLKHLLNLPADSGPVQPFIKMPQYMRDMLEN